MTKEDYIERLNTINLAIDNALCGTKSGKEAMLLVRCKDNLLEIFNRINSFNEQQLELTIVNYDKPQR